MTFNPECLATGIGSFPHLDPEETCNLILNKLPEIPFWPQLSNADFREQMEIQYSEGLPCLRIDADKQRMYFDTSGDPSHELALFYEKYMADDLDYFHISSQFSRGIYAMENRLRQDPQDSILYFKHQVTGPVTFGLGTVDQDKRAIYYNDMFRDVVVKAITMKAKWLLHKFQPLGYQQICFVDEPILSAFGSSTYVSVQRSDVVSCLQEVYDAIHQHEALVGTHCCGNTEWPILIDAGVDIISFDAYEYGDTIAYYAPQIKDFLAKNGVIAWGIVPTSDKVINENPESLTKKLTGLVDNLAGKGIDRDLIWQRCLLTPSCGTGPLKPELANEIFEKLAVLSRALRNAG